MRLVLAIAAATLAAACAPLPRPAGPGEVGPEFPTAYYEEAAARGEAVHRVDPKRSLVVIEVRRGGSMARFGHDHVVSARNVEGYVAPAAGRADLYVALGGLVVDEPALREAAGFDTQPSAADIAGTRNNMLEKVLEADKFPFALIRIARKDPERVTATVTLHGVARDFDVPVKIDAAKGHTVVSGTLAFNQTDFGITPLSILGGAIQVQDRLVLSFAIHAGQTP